MLSAEDAIRDVARLREAFRRSQPEQAVLVRVPLWALEAIDSLEPRELRQVAERVEGRLVLVESH